MSLITAADEEATVENRTTPSPLFPPPELLTPDCSDRNHPVEAAQNAIAWWHQDVTQSLQSEAVAIPLDLNHLAEETLKFSQSIQAIALTPRIVETEITSAVAEFDPLSFVETRWNDTSDPTGNTLETGGPPRLNQEQWTGLVGFRRRLAGGGEFEIGQRIGTDVSNSVFFAPADQANSKLSLSLNQPLLRDGGRVYNASLIWLAQHDTRIARDDVVRQLQDQLFEVGVEYWRLYKERSVVIQKRRGYHRALSLVEQLKARREIDALESQVQRALAVVASREAGITRAQAAADNIQSRLKALTNSPIFWSSHPIEVVPLEVPFSEPINVTLGDAKRTALSNRSEYDQILASIQAAAIRVGMAKNQVLPALGLVVEMYVNGLQGDFALGRSLGDQFSAGAPSYTAGFTFEMPFGNRRASAQLRRRELELVQLNHRYQETVATLTSEVEVALRQVGASFSELQSQRQALIATAAELRLREQRWEELPGDDRSVSFVIAELLDAQDRLTRDEQLYAEAETNYAVSLLELKRAMGTLVSGHSPNR